MLVLCGFVLAALVPAGWVFLAGVNATNVLALFIGGVITQRAKDAAVPVTAGVAAAVLTAALVGFGLFFAVVSTHGYPTMVEAYVPRGGGLLEDFWGPVAWMQITGYTATWVLFACSACLYLPWPHVREALGRVAAAGALVLPLAAAGAVYGMFVALDLVLNIR